MSRMTKPRRANTPRHAPDVVRADPGDYATLERPLLLICGQCGASGRYKVGTVMIDAYAVKSSSIEDVEREVGFTGYFRCRHCDAGGPWQLPDETYAFLGLMLVAALSGPDDVPLVPGRLATFDNRTFRYATEAAAHLQELIAQEPDRAFLWIRLGNLYRHGDAPKLAITAYKRAIEFDALDMEANHSLGEIYLETGRPLKSVPHFHAVLKNARHAQHLDRKLRRRLIRATIDSLLEAHADSHGQIDLLPGSSPDDWARAANDGPVIVECRDLDFGNDHDVEYLCDVYLGTPRRGLREFVRRRERRAMPEAPARLPAVRRDTPRVARNAPCPCGSGHKYKKCCGR